MKRLLILLALLALVMPVAGLSLTFQDSSEFGAYVTCTSTGGSGDDYCAWVQSATGGNSYIHTRAKGPAQSSVIRNIDPQATTYAAATYITGTTTLWDRGYIRLYDSSLAVLYSYEFTCVANDRMEVKMVGGSARIYKNGVLVAASGALAQNPSYVGFGMYVIGSSGFAYSLYLDDFVYGTTENREITGSPEQGYYLKKDLTNPAASGFYDSGDNLISSNNMTTTWGVGDTNTSRTIILKEWSGASNAWTYTTTAGTMAGSIAWPLQEAIFNNPDAPYGYYITTVQGSGVYSSVIPYIAGGGFVNFDSEAYGTGDTAIMTWTVDAGSWDTTTYNYELRVQNALYGTVKDTWSVTSSTGSETVVWDDTDELGVYYVTLWRINKATSVEEMMNGDTCELTGYVRFTGYTHDGEAESALAGVNISITQGSTVNNILSGFDGNYTSSATSPFGTGAAVYINVTKSGYEQYVTSFVPMSAKTIHLNFTMRNLTLTYTGMELDGIMRDDIYGRPISDYNVSVTNSTFGESYTTMGNTVGFFMIDETDGVYLAANRCYKVEVNKTGYASNSTLKCVRAL